MRSWLLELLHDAFDQHGSDLKDIAGYVDDSGEGRWTIFEAINEDVPVPVISAALYARFASRQDESFAAKIDAALRQQFGGHAGQVGAMRAAMSGARHPTCPHWPCLLEGDRPELAIGEVPDVSLRDTPGARHRTGPE